MRLFLDSNFLIYLNAAEDPETREAVEDYYLSLLADHELFTDALVLNELLWISNKKYRVPYEVTVEFIRSVLLPFIDLIPLGSDELLESLAILRYGVPPSDALHLAAMKSKGLTRIVSEDEELEKVLWVNRMWELGSFP